MTTKSNSVMTEEDCHKLKLMVDKTVEDLQKQARIAEEVKETYKQIKAQFNIKPKVARALVKSALKGDFNEVRDEYTEIVDLYETVMTV